MDKDVKVSVLMTVFNGEKYLKEAIDSVLTQRFKEFEFVIVNDGSKDNSKKIIREYSDPRIIVIENEVNRGLIASLNIGLTKCRGKYTARLDQDDIAFPDRFSTQYDFMEKNQDIDVVGSWTECISPDGKSLRISKNPEKPYVIKYEFMFNNVMFHSSIFFRTEKIKINGGYSSQFVHSEDYEMYSRPEKELKCSNIQRPLFKLRIHNESITGSNNTQPTVHQNALSVSFRNISRYINISREEFDYVKDYLIIKKPRKKPSLFKAIKALVLLKKATRAFISENKISLEDIELINKDYRGRRNMIRNHYIIGIYRLLFKKQ